MLPKPTSSNMTRTNNNSMPTNFETDGHGIYFYVYLYLNKSIKKHYRLEKFDYTGVNRHYIRCGTNQCHLYSSDFFLILFVL